MARRLPRSAKALLGLAAAGLVVAIVLLIPVVTKDKREHRDSERRAAAAAQAIRIRRLQAEQRPRRGTLPAGAPRRGLEQRITRDARARGLPTPVKRAECKLLGGTRALSFACTAVTSDIPRQPGSSPGIVGYPYRALVDRRSGRYALCKVSGRPGEGFLTNRDVVRLPRACGG